MHAEPAVPRGASATWATLACFLLGAAVGTAVLWGGARPLTGENSVAVVTAVIAGLIAASSFVVSALLHRRGETAPMPRWQTIVSDASAVALTVAFAGVTAIGVLLTGEILAAGLQGIELRAVGGGIFVGIASATGARFAFGAGVGLRTSDLAQLLLAYLGIGTLFAMITAADPRWWEHHFSTLGVGAGSWAFNGTLIVGGLLVGAVGAYIGRDLHRLLGDTAVGRIAWVVALWATTGLFLALVGVIPVDRGQFAHNLVTFASIGFFLAAGIVTIVVMPRRPRSLIVSTIALLLAIAGAFVLTEGFGLYSVTALEFVVTGLGLLWLTTLVGALARVTPEESRPSKRASLLHE